MGTVAVILKADGSIVSVYGDTETARQKVARFNADPYIAGHPDPDAPYTVQVWWVNDDLPARGAA